MARFNDPEKFRSKLLHIDPTTVSGALFVDTIIAGLGVKNAAELSRRLGVTPAVISRIRGGAPITEALLIGLHIEYGLEIAELKGLMRECIGEPDVHSSSRITTLAASPMFRNKDQSGVNRRD
ncbi:helix-turn-helix domain-containing protein [Agrobacterium tumefaciens]|uniref:helix-turn-helix domain-containing protein n=1 Tax=Agrobacterium tumefaciens TaxID=358 RepID=UPI0015737C2F|nr:helix-turn-helix transcriptional regulator [Agrobacterium tumefaciens]NTB05948.1 helix-turn-helix transcriptional regulator [Agrobacterium tumefaciens]